MFDFSFNMISIHAHNNNIYNKKSKKNIAFGTISRSVKDEKGNIKYRNDTRMFREDLNWNILMNYIEAKKAPQKIYCYACSDGSEPYSIALPLIKKFGEEKAKQFFPIIAKDTDSEMIKKTNERKIDLDSKDIERIKQYQNHIPFFPAKLYPKVEKYWNGAEKPSPYIVDKKLANCVDFKVGNIFDDVENIDYSNSIIFFRNVWPYLKEKDIEQLLDTFEKKFTPSTTLVTGFFDLASNYPDDETFINKLEKRNFSQVRPKIFERWCPEQQEMTLKTIGKSISDEFINFALDKYENLRSLLSNAVSQD